MKSKSFLHIEWEDPGLSWSPSMHGGIDVINLPQNDIWKPDIVLVNGFESSKEMGENFNFVTVFNDGTVIWMPSEVFESRCSIDITYFPFDQQTCSLEFEIWSFIATEVEIYSSEGVEYKDNIQEHSSWKLLGASAEVDNENFYESRISFTLRLQRKPSYYVTNILLPAILLCSLVIAVFLIPAESGEKIGYSITVLLAMSVFLSIVSTILPRNSDDVCLLAVYLLINIVAGVLAVVFTICQVCLLKREDNEPPTGLWAKLCRKGRTMQKVKPMSSSTVVPFDGQQFENEEENNSFVQVHWKDVVKTLDVFLFWSFFILFLVSTCAILGKLIAYDTSSS